MENSTPSIDLFGICPYFTTQKLLSGKWTIYILHLLCEETLRFNELQRRMPENITHTTLSRQLKQLEAQKLVVRNEIKQVPPRVEYSLSEIGMKICPVLESLFAWGGEYADYIKQLEINI